MGILLRSLPCASGAQFHPGATQECVRHLPEWPTRGQRGSTYLWAPKPLVGLPHVCAEHACLMSQFPLMSGMSEKHWG